MKRKIRFLTILSLLISLSTTAQVKIARLKYEGGGNWYVSPTSLPNLIKFCNQNLKTNIVINEEVVEMGSKEIFNYPFVHMTGNGVISTSPSDIANLRMYLQSGGFLHINDSYGMDKYVRELLKKVFPEAQLIEIPYSHPIYHQKYDFPAGLPKIHEHDGKPAQGFGILVAGRLVCFYGFESDIGDGWEDPAVHKDPETKRQNALKMGANILQYVFLGEAQAK
ncbi:MAG: DUF4159 domain-containing protein [Bacteroidota bacterium]|nr:DUF4159 domain-containing protein [Bacteroidota bacterium]